MGKKKFIVIGAGLGGLAVALRLAARGCEVTVYEKNGFVGGRCSPVSLEGCHFDGGPTLLMMLDPFRKLFADVGERLEDHLTIQKCEPGCRVRFGDGSVINTSSDEAKMAEEIRRLSGDQDAKSFSKLLSDLHDLYNVAVPIFVRRNYRSVLDLASPGRAAAAVRYGMLGKLDAMMKSRFRDPRLQTLFCLQSMYLGLSPKDAPSVYSVLVWMEYGEGIWHAKGGLSAISLAVARLAQDRGVQIVLNTPVKSADGKGVCLANGDRIEADGVICNADFPAAARTLTHDRGHRKEPRSSCSALMMYIAYRGSLPELMHHNIFLPREFEQHLDQIFSKKEIPDDPSIYAAVSCRSEPAAAPDGMENLFLLIPAPNLSHHWTDDDVKVLQEKVFKRLEREVGFDRSRVAAMTVRTPHDWEAEFGLYQGAAFGLSHDFFQSICFRPQVKSPTHPGLYYVGASVHPGNGLPMVLISAELAEQQMEADGCL